MNETHMDVSETPVSHSLQPSAAASDINIYNIMNPGFIGSVGSNTTSLPYQPITNGNPLHFINLDFFGICDYYLSRVPPELTHESFAIYFDYIQRSITTVYYEWLGETSSIAKFILSMKPEKSIMGEKSATLVKKGERIAQKCIEFLQHCPPHQKMKYQHINSILSSSNEILETLKIIEIVEDRKIKDDSLKNYVHQLKELLPLVSAIPVY